MEAFFSAVLQGNMSFHKRMIYFLAISYERVVKYPAPLGKVQAGSQAASTVGRARRSANARPTQTTRAPGCATATLASSARIPATALRRSSWNVAKLWAGLIRPRALPFVHMNYIMK